MDIRPVIREFIQNNFIFSDEEDALDDSSSFLENGIIDSTGILELVEFMEEKFSIKIDDEELIPENLDSVDKLTDFVQGKLG